MGSWGVKSRQSDYGLDLLALIAREQLQKANYLTFHVAEALELLRQDIMAECLKANRGCPPEQLDFYIGKSFPQNFTQAALLIAECLADYYRTGELVVSIDENGQLIEHHIRNFVVTDADLQILLEELQQVQHPEHELYQSWLDDEIRAQWLRHIQEITQTLQANA